MFEVASKAHQEVQYNTEEDRRPSNAHKKNVVIQADPTMHESDFMQNLKRRFSQAPHLSDMNKRQSVASMGLGCDPAHPTRHISKLPDKILLKAFSYLSKKELCLSVARVCRKWRMIAYDSRLWQVISLRTDYNDSLHVNSLEALLALIGVRFGSTLRFIELPFDLVTPPILHELANKCPSLKYLTLDFSKAMQLHDFNDLNAFPCNLYSLTVCLSEVIFLEGFMRHVYSSISSLRVLHLIGTFEQSNVEEEEIYEVINISKIKAHTPNLRVVNLYGVTFVDDTHLELLASNCIHIETLAVNFCLKVQGSSFKTLIQRCRKLKTLLAEHCTLNPKAIEEAEWEKCHIDELDISSTELSSEALAQWLPRMPGFRYLCVGHCDFFDDKVMQALLDAGKLDRLECLDIGYTTTLSENIIYRFLKNYGKQLTGLMINGKPKLTEQFFDRCIPLLPKIRICVMGTDSGWFLKLSSKIHIDQVMEAFSQHSPYLERAEFQWDPTTIRFSDKSNKFIDHLRLRCPFMKSLTLSDGEYYEMAKSNFERADRAKVVRATTHYKTSMVSLLTDYKDLLFN